MTARRNFDDVDSQALARRWTRTVRALSSQGLRIGFLRSTLREYPCELSARALEHACKSAQTGDPGARELLCSMAAYAQQTDSALVVRALADCALRMGLLNLSQALPLGDSGDAARIKVVSEPANEDEQHLPDYGTGRPLTLGERKSLARGHDRGLLARVLRDPHPDVIHNVLGNPKITEDDVVTLAARRPLASPIMFEIARHTRWGSRRRVRMALVLNPSCPPDLAMPFIALLLRSELQQVAVATDVHPYIQSAALERLRAMRGITEKKRAPSEPPREPNS